MDCRSHICETHFLGVVVSPPKYRASSRGKRALSVRMRGTNRQGYPVWVDVTFYGDMADAMRATLAVGDEAFVRYHDVSYVRTAKNGNPIIRNVHVAESVQITRRAKRFAPSEFDSAEIIGDLDPAGALAIPGRAIGGKGP